jgi:hypothetical protein
VIYVVAVLVVATLVVGYFFVREVEKFLSELTKHQSGEEIARAFNEAIRDR